MQDRDLIFNTLRELINSAGEQYRGEGTIPRSLLIALYSVVGDCLSPALDIVDRRGVSRLRERGSDEERRFGDVYLVEGSKGTKYCVKKYAHHCSCPAFQFQVVTGKFLTCKHLLALAISDSCGVTKLLKISRTELKSYLKL